MFKFFLVLTLIVPLALAHAIDSPIQSMPGPFIHPSVTPPDPSRKIQFPQDDPMDLSVGRADSEIREVFEFIEQTYPDAVSHRKFRDAAIQGMLRTLDPYSTLLNPEAFKNYEEGLQGSFSGIGIYIENKETGKPIVVRFTLPNGPTFKAGLQSKDMILKIDGKDTASMNQEEFVNLGRGSAGTKAKLLVSSKASAPREVEITREKIVSPLLREEMLSKNVGYIHFSSFLFGSKTKFQNALWSLKGKGARALVLDLRDNGGGSMRDAIAIASYFLEKDDLIITAKYRRKETQYKTREKGSFSNMKLAILINGRSASASELLSGSLQENKKAVLVGSQSFGKALIQETFTDFPEKGYAVKITAGKYYLPSGRSIQKDPATGKGGLMPDLVLNVSADDETLLAQQRMQRLYGQIPEKPKRDDVLEKAVDTIGMDETLTGRLRQVHN